MQIYYLYTLGILKSSVRKFFVSFERKIETNNTTLRNLTHKSSKDQKNAPFNNFDVQKLRKPFEFSSQINNRHDITRKFSEPNFRNRPSRNYRVLLTTVNYYGANRKSCLVQRKMPDRSSLLDENWQNSSI